MMGMRLHVLGGVGQARMHQAKSSRGGWALPHWG